MASMSRFALRAGIAFVATVVLIAPDLAWAKNGGGHHSGSRAGRGNAHGHVHNRGAHARGALLPASPYSYYYAPVLVQPAGPVTYIEQFQGVPTPDTTDNIYCPERAAPFPYVTECPGGWQRIFSQEQATQQAPVP
jgi:hypothetical protein